MIRIYFDSDVINNIHAGNLEDLKELIQANRTKFLIPFSCAHVFDKIPSRNDERFWRDIDYLSEFCNHNYIAYNQKEDFSRPYRCSARDVLKTIDENIELVQDAFDLDKTLNFFREIADEDQTKEGQYLLDDLTRSLDEMVPNSIGSTDELVPYREVLQKSMNRIKNLMNDPSAYKESIDFSKNHYKLPSHAGSWDKDVVDKIDSDMKKSGLDFLELLNKDFTGQGITRHSQFTLAYTMLNVLGYHSDKIEVENGKGVMNHMQDATHAFFGAHCDYFVVMDKKLMRKTKALYEKFNIRTMIVMPDEFLKEMISKVVAFSFPRLAESLNIENRVDFLQEEGFDKSLFRLDFLPFEYFTHAQTEDDPHSKLLRIMLLKRYPNYSDFIFSEEMKCVIRSINSLYGEKRETDEVVSEFINAEDSYMKSYEFENMVITLSFTDCQFFLTFDTTYAN